MLKPLNQNQAIEQAEMLLSVVEILVGHKEDMHDVNGAELALLISIIRDRLLMC